MINVAKNAICRSMSFVPRGRDPVLLRSFVPDVGGLDPFSPRHYQHSNGPVPSPDRDTCIGPRVSGQAQAGRFLTRWLFWLAPDGVRFKTYSDEDWPYGGSLTGLYDGAFEYQKISGAFDATALPAVAIQKTATTIEVKWSSGPSTASWSGLSPILFATHVASPDESDVLCLYLDSDGDALYARFQRDNFATEYTLNSSIEPLSSLDKVDVDGTRVYIWATAKTGKQITLRSAEYPDYPPSAEDNATLTAGFQSGSYLILSVDGGTYTDSATISAGFQSGSYDPSILSESASDTATISSGFQSGSYDYAIQLSNGHEDNATISAGFDSGVYTEVAQSAAAQSDTATLTAGFQTGSYDAA